MDVVNHLGSQRVDKQDVLPPNTPQSIRAVLVDQPYLPDEVSMEIPSAVVERQRLVLLLLHRCQGLRDRLLGHLLRRA